MRYVDAGYTICLSVLFLYAVSLVLRHRRLTRAAAVADPASEAPGAALEAAARLLPEVSGRPAPAVGATEAPGRPAPGTSLAAGGGGPATARSEGDR